MAERAICLRARIIEIDPFPHHGTTGGVRDTRDLLSRRPLRRLIANGLIEGAGHVVQGHSVLETDVPAEVNVTDLNREPRRGSSLLQPERQAGVCIGITHTPAVNENDDHGILLSNSRTTNGGGEFLSGNQAANRLGAVSWPDAAAVNHARSDAAPFP